MGWEEAFSSRGKQILHISGHDHYHQRQQHSYLGIALYSLQSTSVYAVSLLFLSSTPQGVKRQGLLFHLQMKKLRSVTSAGEDVEQLELSHIVGNAK